MTSPFQRRDIKPFLDYISKKLKLSESATKNIIWGHTTFPKGTEQEIREQLDKYLNRK